MYLLKETLVIILFFIPGLLSGLYLSVLVNWERGNRTMFEKVQTFNSEQDFWFVICIVILCASVSGIIFRLKKSRK